MPASGQRAGFSLLEVVVATGIFAVAVTVLLALLPSLMRQSTEAADLLAAQRLPDSLHIELQRLAAADFDGLATTVPVMTTPLADGLLFVAARDGGRLQSVNYRPPAAGQQLPPDQRHFAIEAWRFNQGTLATDATAPVLVVWVRISWPYSSPGSATPTPLAARRQFTFQVSLRR
jgi:prepilin-type N-terminal cleavage/methylation domain-containing protein